MGRKCVCLEEGDWVEMKGGGNEKRQKMKTEKHLESNWANTHADDKDQAEKITRNTEMR